MANGYNRKSASARRKGASSFRQVRTTSGSTRSLPSPPVEDSAPSALLSPLRRKLQRDQPGLSRPQIRHGVRDPSGDPGDLAGLERAGHGRLTLDLVAQVEVGDGHQQMGTVVMVPGNVA